MFAIVGVEQNAGRALRRFQSLRHIAPLAGVAVLLFLSTACSWRPAESASGSAGTNDSAVQPLLDIAARAENLRTTPRTMQNSSVRFERISIEHGLSQSTVYCILQDSVGFLWFGTQDGLNRYDGNSFQVLEHDPRDPSSLRSNVIRALLEDSEGVLWVGTDGGGLSRYDRETGSFTHYLADPTDARSLSQNTVLALYEDQAGLLWVGTGAGLDRLDPRRGTFEHHQPAGQLPMSAVQAILEDDAAALWLGTSAGLYRYDRETGQYTHFVNDALDPRSLSDNGVTALYQDEAGVLWVGTNGGLNRYDARSETFLSHRSNTHDSLSISDNLITAILQDQTGALWIGTDGGGVDRFDVERRRFVHNLPDPTNSQSLTDPHVLSLYEDREGGLWVGTSAGGVFKSNLRQRQITHYRHIPGDPNSLSDNVVRAISEDQEGILWVGTTSGLDRLDPVTGRFEHFQHDPLEPGSLADDTVLSVFIDQSGVLWVGTMQGGLQRFVAATQSFIPYQHSGLDPLSLSHNTARTIHQARDGKLYIGTGSGLDLLDPRTGNVERLQYRYRLTGNEIRTILEDRSGILWIGTSTGLNGLDLNTSRVTRYTGGPCDSRSLCGAVVLSIHEDKAGNLWVGTFQGGLSRLDRETNRFRHYREQDGLANDVVYGILEDRQGNLWMSTNQGISRFDPATETFTNFDVEDGLQSNEFNGGAYYQSASGEMFFGGIKGLSVFYPEELQQNSLVPPIVLTALTLSGEDLHAGTTVGAIDRVRLKWPNNFFEFEFAALSYTQPRDNQYAYMLEGFDRDWIQAGNRPVGKYTNLPGKTYTLRLKGSNNDRVWNTVGTALPITVVPPFWSTWWFRGTALSVALLAVVAGLRLRVRGIEARSRQLELLVEERTAELRREVEQRLRAEEALRESEMEKAVAAERSRLARELHDAVTQTLFSSSLIAEALPAAWARDREEGRQLLKELQQSSRGVLAEMRTLLLELRPAALVEANLADLLRQLAEAARTREDLPVGVTVEGQCDLPPDVHVAFYRIAQEGLNNVVKHARASDVHISLRCQPRGQVPGGQWRATLCIRDNGRGYHPERIAQDRLGLGIMRERAEAIGAELEMVSEIGGGTTVRVSWVESAERMV
jgi:ligand-binding sensor domain-containing protein/signal transduction histidine kinase